MAKTIENPNDIIAFGMTGQEVADAILEIEKEYTNNEQDSSSWSEYAQNVQKGREMLKNHAGYYPYLGA